MTGMAGGTGTTRRAFLKGAAASAAVATWAPALRTATASAAAPAPPGLPPEVAAYRQGFRNWTGEIVVDDVWTCAPRTPEQVVALADWAHRRGWQLRARGAMHSFSPLTLPPGATPARVLLVDTTEHLTRVQVSRRDRTVTAQTGVRLEDLLATMAAGGLGFAATPAVGDITLGGALAIGGHGTAVRARGERHVPGQTTGSLSNLVRSLTAVVWDERAGRYALRTFDRTDPDIGPLLVHLGRTFVVEVTMQAAPRQRLRCQSRTDIPIAELLAPPGSPARRTLARHLDESGRLEVIWFPFTRRAWLKVWSVAPRRPRGARAVAAPYAYAFSDHLPAPVSDLAAAVLSGVGRATPAYCRALSAASAAGLVATGTSDLWGWAKDVQLYVRPTTMRYTMNGFAVHCRRADVQRVVSEVYARYSAMVDAAAAAGSFPMNGPVEIRVTGVDDPADSEVPGAVAAALSALRPWAGHPEWDTAVWIDCLTLPGTPGALAFLRDLERWMLERFAGWAGVRVEWSKGFAYTTAGAQTDPDVLGRAIPATFPSGPSGEPGWIEAVAVLDRLDPHRTFSNPFLDRLVR